MNYTDYNALMFHLQREQSDLKHFETYFNITCNISIFSIYIELRLPEPPASSLTLQTCSSFAFSLANITASTITTIISDTNTNSATKALTRLTEKPCFCDWLRTGLYFVSSFSMLDTKEKLAQWVFCCFSCKLRNR